MAGAAAGIAAAFNTPLGGIVFALEQLARRRGMSHIALVIASIVLSGLVSVSAFGNVTYFGQLRVQELSWSLMGSGLAGGLVSQLRVPSLRGAPDRFCRWRHACPLRFAAGCDFVVAVIGIVTDGSTVGAGYALTRGLLEGQDDLLALSTLLKFCATWLSAWTGVPAGVFAPSLTTGAGIGRDVAWLAGVGPEVTLPRIALGMVGFLSATTQGPITAFIAVMEMAAGQAIVLSLVACAPLASGLSRMSAAPRYEALAAMVPVPQRGAT